MKIFGYSSGFSGKPGEGSLEESRELILRQQEDKMGRGFLPAFPLETSRPLALAGGG